MRNNRYRLTFLKNHFSVQKSVQNRKNRLIFATSPYFWTEHMLLSYQRKQTEIKPLPEIMTSFKERINMFELIAILGLSAIVVSCAVNLFEMAFFTPEEEPPKILNAQKDPAAEEYIA